MTECRYAGLQKTHLGVQHVLIVVYNDVSKCQHVPRQVVWAPAFLAAPGAHVMQRVHARIQHSLRSSSVQPLVELACLYIHIISRPFPHPGSRQAPAFGVHTLARAFICHARINSWRLYLTLFSANRAACICMSSQTKSKAWFPLQYSTMRSPSAVAIQHAFGSNEKGDTMQPCRMQSLLSAASNMPLEAHLQQMGGCTGSCGSSAPGPIFVEVSRRVQQNILLDNL